MIYPPCFLIRRITVAHNLPRWAMQSLLCHNVFNKCKNRRYNARRRRGRVQ
jgi:hypothetical protein